MSARFIGVFVRFQTAVWLGCVGLASALSCSVFPDEATLPMSAGAATGGSSVLPQAGAGGAESTPSNAGAAGTDAEAGQGGASGGAGGVPPISVGGAPEVVAGAGGVGGAPDCANPQSVVGAVTSDTWIESAKPNANHGNDKALSVIAGGEERRALLQVALPAVPPGAVLLRAALLLHLESNADAGLAMRRLAVRKLDQDVLEGRASWLNWNNGNRTWLLPGGDFGPVLARAVVPAGASDAVLTFDVTVPVEQALSAQAAGLPFIVLETSAPPPPPAELAFTAKGGNASGIPTLIVDYCEP